MVMSAYEYQKQLDEADEREREIERIQGCRIILLRPNGR